MVFLFSVHCQVMNLIFHRKYSQFYVTGLQIACQTYCTAHNIVKSICLFQKKKKKTTDHNSPKFSTLFNNAPKIKTITFLGPTDHQNAQLHTISYKKKHIVKDFQIFLIQQKCKLKSISTGEKCNLVSYRVRD